MGLAEDSKRTSRRKTRAYNRGYYIRFPAENNLTMARL